MTINVFGGGNSSAPVFPVQRSVRLRSSASAYFNRTPASAGNRKTWTWSAWVKRGTLGAYNTLFSSSTSGANTDLAALRFTNTDTLQFFAANATNAAVTTAVFRDPSAWYHIVAVLNTTGVANGFTLYVNGVQQTLTYTSFTADLQPSINNTVPHNVGAQLDSGSGRLFYFDGYLTEVNFIDGQALTPSSFGSINSSTGVWQPIKYSGTYGTNGFYLNFQDNSAATAAAIGKDSSGNGNNWTPNNISVTAGVTYDSMLDVPTLTSATNANFATLNPIGVPFANGTVTDGNLKFAGLTTTDKGVAATISISSGTFYWESTQLSNSGASNCYAGVILTGASSDVNANRVYVRGDGVVWKYGTNLGTVFPTFTNNDVIGCAYDRANNTLALYKNGTLGYTVTSLNNSDHTPWVGGYTTTDTWAINFGQRPFSYTPPTGFKSLNTFNLPDSTIPNGATQFAATTYTGTGSSLAISNTVNGKSFQPDFVWVKGRSGATDHALYDSVRGTTLDLISNSTAAETTQATGLTAFGSSGFTVGALAKLNTNTATYVGWQWKAGGTAVTNTSGSITSQVSANPSAGFSIVTWTGTGAAATVGHGLGVAPSMVIWKYRSAVSDWAVGHNRLNNGSSAWSYWLALNTTAAQAASSGPFNNTAPTSTVFSVGSFNANATTMVGYCFSEIAGFSKAFSYTGNGSTDGVFSYLGFKPRMILLKRTDTTGNWYIWDTSRNTYNVVGEELYPNLNNAAATATDLDLLSNGFKLRNSTAGFNASGGTYVGFAWAENPFKNSLAI